MTMPATEGVLLRKAGWQFSLATLLATMAWLAITCVALRAPNDLWTAVVFLAAIGSLITSTLVIIYRRGSARAVAIGFAIAGTAYSISSSGDTPDVVDAHATLPTTRWGIRLYSLLHADKTQTSTTMSPIYSTPVAALNLTAPPSGFTVERVVNATAVQPVIGETTTPVAPSMNVPTVLPVPPASFIARTTTQPTFALAAFLGVVHNSLVRLLGAIGGIVAQTLHSTQKTEVPNAAA